MKLISQIDIIYSLILYQFKTIFPYWAAGVAAGSVLSVFASGWIGRIAVRLPQGRPGFMAASFAALLGAASPICMYGTMPLMASLVKKGIPQYLLAAFMVSSILINPNLLILSFAISAPIALARLFFSILAGVAAGIAVSLLFRKDAFFSFDGLSVKKRHAHSPLSKARQLLNEVNGTAVKTAPYFLAGIALTAVIDRLFPKDILVFAFSNNQGLGVLLATSLGVPLYLCGGGTIPLVKSMMENGMSAGAAMAFMMIGPATKINNLGAVKMVLGARNFLLYILFNVLFAIAAGLFTDFLYIFH